ncbi:MAG: beta-ketoacyl-ACP synthase III [Gemmatimonadales bacterium]|nr:beta-ketoacyl-ACP synthase III [Gemmatimonadales bacterium]HRX19212.1 beta-ketoacyl-ACP synthase III [Gemmatimonadales bacterium]
MTLARPVGTITGLGAAAPEGRLTNADLERYLDTSDEWIVERTGIRERRIAAPEETLTSYAAEASRRAMAQAGVTADEIDGIVFATVTPDRRLPSAACDLQAELGAKRAWAFDLVAACPGWVYALTVAEGLMATGQGDTLLVVGAEKLSSITDAQDRSTAILFGDGAGACILRRTPEGSDRGVLATYLGADGDLAELLYIPAGGSAEPLTPEVLTDRRHLMRMAGREVFKAAVLAMSRSTDEAIRRAGLPAEAIELLVPHQANLRIIEATAKHAGIPMAKVMVNLDRYGNTSSASIPLALAQAQEEGRLRPGMIVMLVAFGAGFTWGSVVLRW